MVVGDGAGGGRRGGCLDRRGAIVGIDEQGRRRCTAAEAEREDTDRRVRAERDPVRLRDYPAVAVVERQRIGACGNRRVSIRLPGLRVAEHHVRPAGRERQCARAGDVVPEADTGVVAAIQRIAINLNRGINTVVRLPAEDDDCVILQRSKAESLFVDKCGGLRPLAGGIDTQLIVALRRREIRAEGLEGGIIGDLHRVNDDINPRIIRHSIERARETARYFSPRPLGR